MQIKEVRIKNFRLLRDVAVGLEERTTLVVGRNNSGKTSLGELFRRLLGDKPPSFRMEDFSLGCHEEFWIAYSAFQGQGATVEVMEALPRIQIEIELTYKIDDPDLGLLSECIVDLDPNCTTAKLICTYGPKFEGLPALFADISIVDDPIINRRTLFRALGSRIAAAYESIIEAVDPNDPTNRKVVEAKLLPALINGSFINAHRGLDDDTFRERDVLGKVVEALFQSAITAPPESDKRTTAEQLKAAVEGVQGKLHDEFNLGLNSLLPAFDLFGYPGLADPGLMTETNFDVEKLLSNHTKVRYVGINGLTLPETYNGLGVRNLIYMLLQLLRYFREYQAKPRAAGVHLIFIEEPEAHLHPQMQEVFIRQLGQIVSAFATQLNENKPWPVQFVVSTHSSHMANESRFEAMRYFLSVPDGKGIRRSVVKDLRKGMGNASEPDRNFLHQYLTLTRCDLFFADKAILIEGTSERLLLPAMIRKTDSAAPDKPQLGSQYLTVMEVGGAYAHRFFDLLSFLELRTLIITDIDSVKPNADGKRLAEPVATSTFTSNGCLKSLFGDDVSPQDLLGKSPEQKTTNLRRTAFQIPEAAGGPCGRSFEDAFILANPDRFPLVDPDLARAAYDMASEKKKSSFALEHAIEQTDWHVPLYIGEGLRWLAEGVPAPTAQTSGITVDIVANEAGVAVNIDEAANNG